MFYSSHFFDQNNIPNGRAKQGHDMSNMKLMSGILLFLALGGLLGGIAFITKPDGDILNTPLQLLEHSPVNNYFWPGVFLLLFMGLWPVVNIYGLLAGRHWTKISNFLLGLTTVIWITYEAITIRTFSPLQPIILSVGILLMMLAGKSTINFKRDEAVKHE